MGKLLRIVGIVLMGLTAVFTLMGGAGTTCVALAAENWPDSFGAIVPYKWLYMIFVLATIACGVLMVRGTALLVKGRSNAYRCSLIALAVGIAVGVIHMLVSRALRGNSMPVDAVTYSAVLTLAIFLLFRIPGIWEQVNFDKTARESDNSGPAGAAITLLLSGLLTLTIQVWMRETHTIGGVNWANAWNLSMGLLGWAQALAGLGLGGWLKIATPREKHPWFARTLNRKDTQLTP